MVTNTVMQIFRADDKSTGFSVYVYAKDLSEKNFSEKIWKFPPMELALQTTLKRSYQKITDPAILHDECEISEEYPAVMKITFKIPAGWRNEDPLLEITPFR